MLDVLSADRSPAPTAVRRRWRARAAAVAAAVVVPVLWWSGSTDPLAPSSGGYAVVSDVAPVASVRVPFGDTAYVATYVEGERVTLLFPLGNDGRVPVRVTDVFPAADRLSCGWVPDRVEISASLAGDYRPFQPLWFSPGEIVDLSVSGRFDCGGEQGLQSALSSYSGVPVQWSLGGLVPRSSQVPTGYDFGWTEAPDQFLDDLVDRDGGSRSR